MFAGLLTTGRKKAVGTTLKSFNTRGFFSIKEVLLLSIHVLVNSDILLIFFLLLQPLFVGNLEDFSTLLSRYILLLV